MAAEAQQKLPLAPAKFNPRSDEEFAFADPAAIRPKPKPKPAKSGKCFVYVLTGIVLQCVIILVFAVVVLRARSPDFNLNSVRVHGLNYYSSSPYLNATLGAEVRIKNSNFGGFMFGEAAVSVLYGDVAVGEAKFVSGQVERRKTEMRIITVDVMSHRLSDTKNLTSDINSGMVKLRSYAELRGRVRLLKILTKKRTAVMNCTMNLNLSGRSIQDLLCN